MNKIAKGVGIVKKARPFLNKSVLSNLYHTFIYQYLIYCVDVWGSAKKVHLNASTEKNCKNHNIFGSIVSH